MSNDEVSSGKQQITIRLTGLQPGTSPDDLVIAIKRIIPRQPLEKIRLALDRLPLTLTRTATKDQAKKIKNFLDSNGAILKISYSTPATPQAPRVEAEQYATVEKTQAPSEPSSSKGEESPPGAERRAKPRVHPGIQLHLMGIGEILDRSFRLLRQYFLLFFIILLIPQIAFFLAGKGMQLLFTGGFGQSASMTMGAGFGISFFLALVVFIILQFWAQGALIHAVSETYLGHNTSVGAAYGAMRQRLGWLLGTLILMGLLMVLVPALSGILSAIFIPLLLKLGISKLIIGLLVAGFIIFSIVAFFHLLLNWLMVDKVVVLEERRWVKALRRSKELMKSRTDPGFWKSTKMKAGLILLLGFLIGIGINLCLQVPGLIFQFLMPGNVIIMTIHEVLNMAATSLATVYTAIAMILFYYDIRLRKEGFDLRMMAENL